MSYYNCIKNNDDFRLFDDMMYIISGNIIVYPNGDHEGIPSINFLNEHFIKADDITFYRYHRRIYGIDIRKPRFAYINEAVRYTKDLITNRNKRIKLCES
jgi:hypothetical protein